MVAFFFVLVWNVNTILLFTVWNPLLDTKLDVVWHAGLHSVVLTGSSASLYDLQPITPHNTLFGVGISGNIVEISNSKLDFKSEWLKEIQLPPLGSPLNPPSPNKWTLLPWLCWGNIRRQTGRRCSSQFQVHQVMSMSTWKKWRWCCRDRDPRLRMIFVCSS